MPFANIHTLAGALELVQGANASNGGIIIDLWHVVKLGIRVRGSRAHTGPFSRGH